MLHGRHQPVSGPHLVRAPHHGLVRFYIPPEARWTVVSGRDSFDWPADRKPKSLGEQITMADICLASQVAGANFFKVDLAPYPTVARIAATCAKNEAFARAHPLKQGAGGH